MSFLHPLLQENDAGVLPVDPRYKSIDNKRIELQNAHWSVEEAQLDQDLKGWQSLPINTQEYLTKIFAFFKVGDKQIKSDSSELARMTEQQAYKEFYILKAYNESIHQRAYEMLPIAMLIRDVDQRRCDEFAKNHPVIVEKIKFINQIELTKENYTKYSIILAITEFMFFASSFVPFYWLADTEYYKLIKRTIDLNKWVARDEGLHSEVEIIKITEHTPEHLLPPKTWIQDKIRDGCELEKKFAKECLGDNGFSHIPTADVLEYVEFLANRLSVLLNCDELYPGKKCKLEFMHKMRTNTKGDIHTNGSAGNYHLTPEQGTSRFVEF